MDDLALIIENVCFKIDGRNLARVDKICTALGRDRDFILNEALIEYLERDKLLHPPQRQIA